MALSGSSLSSTLLSLLQARGANGDSLPDFCDAVGDGIVDSVAGKPFATIDAGSVSGAGTGSGTGIVISPGIISPLIFSTSVASFGGFGPDLQDFCDDIESAVIQEMLNASLSSTHTPVFLGTGTITPGSIPVLAPEVALQVTNQGISRNLGGPDWPGFALAIGTGVAAGFLTATGTVTITGSGGTPSGGSGVGVGVIS